MKKRLDWIDIAKGLLIIMIIYGHIDYQSAFSSFLYSFHVQAFFVISGFLFGHNKSEDKYCIKDFLVRKFEALMIPYFSFSLLVIIYNTILALINGNNFKPILINLYETLSMLGILTLWFLPILFGAEVLYLAIRKLSFKISTAIILIAVLISLLLSQILSSSFSFVIYNILLVTFRVLRAVTLMYIGNIIYILMNKFLILDKPQLIFNLIATVLFVSLGVLSFLFLLGGNEPRFTSSEFRIVSLIHSTICSFAVIYLSKTLSKIPNKVITFLGKNSLIIMATHQPLEIIYLSSATTVFLTNIINNHIINSILVLIVTMIFEAILIFVINRFFPFILGKKPVQISKSNSNKRSKTE